MSEPQVDPRANFPRYMMKIDGKRSFLTLYDAGVAYDAGHARVEICRHVLLEDFTVRAITEKEKREISRIADEYSASK